MIRISSRSLLISSKNNNSIAERLDYLWFLGYQLDDPIPNHSVLSKARKRWGKALFVSLFSRVVQQCVEAGLVEGSKIHVDACLVEANANLRSVKPLDTDTVMASVARTGRLLCVGESWPWGGVTAEVVARVASEGFNLLDAPPQRLNAKDTPVPYHPSLWAAHRPTARSIAAAARRLLHS